MEPVDSDSMPSLSEKDNSIAIAIETLNDSEQSAVVHRTRLEQLEHSLEWIKSLQERSKAVSDATEQKQARLAQIRNDQAAVADEMARLEEESTSAMQTFTRSRQEVVGKISEVKEKAQSLELKKQENARKEAEHKESERLVANEHDILIAEHDRVTCAMNDEIREIRHERMKVANEANEHQTKAKKTDLETQEAALNRRIAEAEAARQQRDGEFTAKENDVANACRLAESSLTQHQEKQREFHQDQRNATARFEERRVDLTKNEESFQLEVNQQLAYRARLSETAESLRLEFQALEANKQSFDLEEDNVNKNLDGRERVMRRQQEEFSRNMTTLEEGEKDILHRNKSLQDQLSQLASDKIAFEARSKEKVKAVQQLEDGIAVQRKNMDVSLQEFREKVAQLHREESEFDQEVKDTNNAQEAADITIKEQETCNERVYASLVQERNELQQRKKAYIANNAAYEEKTTTLHENTAEKEREEASANDLERDVDRRQHNHQKRMEDIADREAIIATRITEIDERERELVKKELLFGETRKQLDEKASYLGFWEEDIQTRREDFTRRRDESMSEANRVIAEKEEHIRQNEDEIQRLQAKNEKTKRDSQSVLEDYDSQLRAIIAREVTVGHEEQDMAVCDAAWTDFQKTLKTSLNETLEGRAVERKSNEHLALCLHDTENAARQQLVDQNIHPERDITEHGIPSTEALNICSSQDAMITTEADDRQQLRRSTRVRRKPAIASETGEKSSASKRRNKRAQDPEDAQITPEEKTATRHKRDRCPTPKRRRKGFGFADFDEAA